MPMTYGDAKRQLSKYAGVAGRCANASDVDSFILQVFQYMLFSGAHGSLRKFCFNAIKGCITLPYELETPLKVKIDDVVGTVWGKWYEYYNYDESDDCLPAGNALIEEANTYYTVYDVPCASSLGVLGTCAEASDANVIIQGLDASGREVVTYHNGEQIRGEYLSIRKGELRYTHTKFSKVTGIVKTRTKGYVPLFWVDPETGNKGFLAEYGPNDEIPSYRRYRLTAKNCGPSVKVTVIGRIRLKQNYADADIIPFDNMYAMHVAAQSINAQLNDNVAVAEKKDATLQSLINRESDFKRVDNGKPLEVFGPTSAGIIRNIV